MLPLLALSFVAAARQTSRKTRNLILWLALVVILWVLLAAIRGGADLYDNPRYRTILFLWQAVLAGYVWVWWRETRSPWFPRVVLMEVLFLLVFTQWYASRYYHWGGQLQFPVMIALILALWGLVLGVGWWQDRKRAGRGA
jgi:peptidoglycan/LPS O-acetylase OafA/YrhL